MARMPRLVVPGYPHHVTQRGNRKLQTFFSENDFRAYVNLIAEMKERSRVEIWAYCLMPNHVHLVAVPSHEDGLAEMMQHSHRRYARRVNKRENWQGHLWQERFHSILMDERHLFAAVRYIELNPVAAGLCNAATDWPWSSVHAHVRREDDKIVTVQPMLKRVPHWSDYLAWQEDSEAIKNLRANVKSGRPVGDDRFINRLEELTGRKLRKSKPGPRQLKSEKKRETN